MLLKTVSHHSGEKFYLRKFWLTIISLALVSIHVNAQHGWTQKAQIPTPRGGACACVVDNKIYVIGGITGSPGYSDLAVNEMYDPSTNTWTTKSPLPVARGYLSCAVVSGIIYAIGGGYPTATKRVDAYDPATNTWTQKQDMLSVRRSAQACVVDGIIYVIGGNPGSSQTLRSCEAYNPVTNTWTVKTSMPAGGGSVALTVYNGLIYVFGGSTYSPWAGFSNVYAYNPQTNSWVQKQSMPTARFGLQTYIVGDKIYAIGGSQSQGTILSTIEVYDPAADTWETLDPMPQSLAWFAGAVVNNKIYVISGTPDWATGDGAVWEYDPNSPFTCSASTINFGDVLCGSSGKTVSVTIKNTSTQSYNFTSIVNNKNEFSLNLPSLPKTIEPSDSIQFEVLFHPNNHGRINDEVVVTTNNTEYSALTILLEGRGILFGALFNKFVDRINSVDQGERTAIVDSFLTKHPSMPLIEQDSICQFIYYGDAASASLVGDVNNWNADKLPMTRLSSTNLWYCSEMYEPDARLEYKFALNGSNWVTDPKNPVKAEGTDNSEVTMPAYVRASETKYYPEIPHGAWYDAALSSEILGRSRSYRLYTPPMYNTEGTDSFCIALFHDGIAWSQMAINVIDYLIYNNRIQPMIAVFVPPVSRDEEYIGGQQNQFSAFIAAELMPYIDSHYRTKRNPDNRAILGASNGGNIALRILSEYPQEFGNAASYSGYITGETSSSFENKSVQLSKLYIDAGTYDLAGFLEISRNFKQIIEMKGYNFLYNEWHEGHNWGNWNAHLDNALEFFFPGSAVDVKEERKEMPASFALYQNYPNPFNPTTTIKYSIPGQTVGKENFRSVHLIIYDVLGREVATLVNEEKPAGIYEVEFNATSLSSGIYFYQLKAGDLLSTKKMLMIK